MATTTNYSFQKPTVGGNEDTWGTLLNENWDSVDTELKAVADEVAAYKVPSGGIIMWSGAIGAIPSGWYLCDGNNGTPNLTDRFVIGAGSSYSVGDTGGAATDTATTSSNGSHSHGGSTGTSSVTISRDGWGNSGGLGAAASGRLLTGTGASESGEFLESAGAAANNLTSGSHNHTISSDGAHTHSVTVDTIPPYYALAYIMKA